VISQQRVIFTASHLIWRIILSFRGAENGRLEGHNRPARGWVTVTPSSFLQESVKPAAKMEENTDVQESI
jgi:hypothetical protein